MGNSDKNAREIHEKNRIKFKTKSWDEIARESHRENGMKLQENVALERNEIARESHGEMG